MTSNIWLKVNRTWATIGTGLDDTFPPMPSKVAGFKGNVDNDINDDKDAFNTLNVVYFQMMMI